MGTVHSLKATADEPPTSEPKATAEPTESELLHRQLARVQEAFFDGGTRPTDLKALSVEMRELRALIKAAKAAENKAGSAVADTPDEPLS